MRLDHRSCHRVKEDKLVEGEVKALQMNWILCFDHGLSERGSASIPEELLVRVCESETLS